jgi:hypothetical protein
VKLAALVLSAALAGLLGTGCASDSANRDDY